MKKLIILGFVLLLSLNFTGGTVLAEGEWEADFERIDELYERMKEADPGEKKELMKRIIEISTELVEKHSDSPEVLWKAAASYSNYAYYDIENPLEILEQGRKYVERSIELTPDKGRGYFWLGTFLGQIGQEKGIIQSMTSIKPMRDNLEKAIEFEPDFAPAYDIIARLYFQAPGWPISIGNNNKALEYRIKSVELAPENLHYQWSLYEIYRKVGEAGMAKQVLKTIINMTEKGSGEEAEEFKEKAKEALKNYN